jgi:RHH-type proline utilization regulon transcriptional repressor/proline dehydrogenase/delta 1-pyrroline-5-carboxylate dehydrogenase
MNVYGISDYKLENGTTFYFYDYCRDHLFDGDRLRDEVSHELDFLNSFDGDLRRQVIFKGVSFLISFNKKENSIRLGSVRLANEIFLLDQIESNPKDCAQIVETEVYKKFKLHVQNILATSRTGLKTISEQVTKKYQLEELADITTGDVSRKMSRVMEQLHGHLNDYSPVFFERISDFALSLTANYALLRIHLLKFLAILPSLDHDTQGKEVKRILLESLERLLNESLEAKKLKLKGERRALPLSLMLLFYIALAFFKIMPAGPLARVIRYMVRFMAKRFIAGETIELAQESFKELFSTGRDVTLDQLGELVVSEHEADNYMKEVLNLINGFSLHIPAGQKNDAGIYRAHVSIKVSALCSDFKPEAFDYTYKLVAPRLSKILTTAKQKQVFINIDAEHYHYRDVVFKIYRKLLLETEELKDYQQTGIVLQAYLRDSAKHLSEIVDLAKERGLLMPIRLVKGAYWDAETIEADAHAYDAPEFLNKSETDINFRQLINEIYKAYPHIQLCIASHNFSDHAYAYALKEEKYPSLPSLEHQCLHMTYEALSTAMAKMGWVVRNYVPIGSLLVGMAYLVRRIMENSSQVGVLTIMRSHKKGVNLYAPNDVLKMDRTNGNLTFDKSVTELNGEFFNITPLRTYLDDQLEVFKTELEDFKNKEMDKEYVNKFHTTGDFEVIHGPNGDETPVGKIRFATVEDAAKAVDSIDTEFYEGVWGNLTWVERVTVMAKAADLMLLRRNKLTALIMMESGKALNEALADVDEAIDFINFYSREQYKLSSTNYTARGPSAVIAPWNFPIAIACGMTVSSLISGNTVILKSAEQTPLVANELIDILHEAGVPHHAVIHLPGMGETVGQYLVDSEKISTIIFTGSKPVGVSIFRNAAKRLYFNRRYQASYPVRVITEMGGKNAIIVTNNAELDETVAGILYSAYAHSGQKCSACSRVIVDNQIKYKLIARLAEAAKDLKVGRSDDFSVFVNPLITKGEKERLISQVERATQEAKEFGGKVIIDRSAEELPGNAVGPTIIELPKARAMKSDSFAQIELFAPVVHIIGVNGLDEALEVYNSVEYGLTGGVFSQSQDDLDYCQARLQNGNIYINRAITGARVAIEPFGGFKMSGTGPKAGGLDYVKSMQVLLPKSSDKGQTVLEEGSNYSVKLSRSSGLRTKNRIAKVAKSVDNIINNFGPLFSGVFGEEKKRLQSLQSWLLNDFELLLDKGRPNRIIPGQVNISKFDSLKESAVYVCLNERPTMDTFIHFLVAIASGVGMTILCTNQKAYIWWQYLIDILAKNGLSKRNIDCYFVGVSHIEKLDKTSIDVVIIDGDDETTKTMLEFFVSATGDKLMTSFITTLESVVKDDFTDVFIKFAHERSYAINVMRHGAPMELMD